MGVGLVTFCCRQTTLAAVVDNQPFCQPALTKIQPGTTSIRPFMLHRSLRHASTMASAVEVQELLTDTLALLEWRLHRLEFILNGDTSNEQAANDTTQPSGNAHTVLARVRKLEQSLQQIMLKSGVASDLLTLRMLSESVTMHFDSRLTKDRSEARRPDLFSADSPLDSPDEPDTSQKLAMVLSEAPAYSEVASQLRHLGDLSIPPADAFAKLIAMHPRMANVRRRQCQQAGEISDLRRRSSALVLQWHEVFILGQGRCWVDWDTRLRKAERTLRREEVRRAQDG